MNQNDHIHLIGIGGTGLSAIARVLHERGVAVSGSDRELSPLARSLQESGIRVSIGHDPSNVNGATLVVRSSAIPDDNPEVRRAHEKGIPVVKRADFLGDLLAGKTVIAIAGTHGKTTTTAMTAWVLSEHGLAPSFIVGGLVQDLGVNARAGSGPHFVIEADEYDYMFLGLSPDIAVVNNVEHDHPDCFPTEADFILAFEEFAARLKPNGTLIVWGEDAQARALLTAGRAGLTFGFGPENDLAAENLQPVAGAGYAFEAVFKQKERVSVRLRLPGRHNVLNALAVLGVAYSAGIALDQAAEALSRFSGASRRFEVRGDAAGVRIVDDYAHHPTEIRVTIEAARQTYPNRKLRVVWQPHTFSRLAAFQGAFGPAFAEADHVLVTAVYASREQAPAGFSIRELLSGIGEGSIEYVSGREEAVDRLAAVCLPGDLVLVLSAGDAVEISAALLERLKLKEQA